jgi:acylphosphatase
MAVRARLTIRGRVQGVWYRGSMQEEATRLRVSGWVRNQPDGSVAAETQGERAAVDALVAWAHEGPPGARVTDVAVEWVSPHDDERGFAIRR